MPRVLDCAFCGKKFHQGTGIMHVKNDASTIWFCSSKCRKNGLKLRRDPRKLKWTEYYKKEEKTRI